MGSRHSSAPIRLSLIPTAFGVMTDPLRCPARVKSSSPPSGSESALAPTLTRHMVAEEDAHGSSRVAQSKQSPVKPERFGPRAWRARSQSSPAPSCVRRALSSFDMHLKALETSHDRRAPVPRLGPRERDPLESRRRARDDGARLHARELGADALVHSVPECCVLGQEFVHPGVRQLRSPS